MNTNKMNPTRLPTAMNTVPVGLCCLIMYGLLLFGGTVTEGVEYDSVDELNEGIPVEVELDALGIDVVDIDEEDDDEAEDVDVDVELEVADVDVLDVVEDDVEEVVEVDFEEVEVVVVLSALRNNGLKSVATPNIIFIRVKISPICQQQSKS